MNQNADRTILIVDDEKDIRLLLQECLEMEGYRVLSADCGANAIAMLVERPDLILLDVNMPDLDGYLVCEKIRDYVSCPIIFLTARTQEQDRVAGLKAGGDDYVLKPFGMEELLARIEAHLRREARSARLAEGLQILENARPGSRKAESGGSGNGKSEIPEMGDGRSGNGKSKSRKIGRGGSENQKALNKEFKISVPQEPSPVYWEGDLEVDTGGRRILCRGQDLGLTKTEFNIAEMLLRNRGRVLGKEQIYERVRGYDGSADANIITEHIRRIRRKIQVYSDREYILTVWGVGYRWNG